MAFNVTNRTDHHIKQMPDVNPYEVSPSSLETEMMNFTKFSKLPQEPPPATPDGRSTLEETNMLTEQHNTELATTTFKNPPPYTSRQQHGHHFYEEVNQAALKMKLKDSECTSPSSLPHSHTEVDQAILFPQSSTTNSLAPLTEPVERKPRKKVNPLYDSYRDDNTLDSPEPCGMAVEKVLTKHRGPAGHIGSVLRHPCIIFLLMVLLIVLVVIFVLLMQGTITSKGLAASQTGSPPNSSTDAEVSQLKKQIEDQQRFIDILNSKMNQLEKVITLPGNENASVQLRVTHNAMRIMGLNDSIQDLNEEMDTISAEVKDAKEQSSSTIATLAAVLNRVTLLENQTNILHDTVNSLHGNLQTHSTTILRIQEANQLQDNEIIGLGSQISVVQQQLVSELAEYNASIFEELKDITKMQGPRGFNGSDGAPGSGDLSRCSYDTSSRGSSVSIETTLTTKISAGTNEILTGITCSTSGGDRALLKTVPETATEPEKFYCECSGMYDADVENRYCSIHIWKCQIT